MTDVSRNINYTRARETPRKKRRWVILVSVIVFLVALRLVLPFFVLKYVNKTLGESKTYPGHVEDVNLALIRGAYKIREIRIDKHDTLTGKTDSVPFFTAREVELSVEWRALFKGKIVGEITVHDPRVNFVKERHEGEDTRQDTADFREVIKGLMPLTVNRFEVVNGRIHYLDPFNRPPVDVALTDIAVVAHNLTNVNDSATALPASLRASAGAYGGTLRMDVRFNPLKKQPTFDLNTEFRDVDMVRLNDFFRAYGNFDVNKGSFGFFCEFAAKEGKFSGYVKPLIKDLDVVQWRKEEGNLPQVLWESVVGAAGEVFENQPKEQVATKVPVNGTFSNPEVGLWNAISYVLRNAFVNALQPSIDQTITLGDVEAVETEETFLQKVFGKNKDGGEKKKDKSSRKSR